MLDGCVVVLVVERSAEVSVVGGRMGVGKRAEGQLER
jgi:hypothetical protein